MNRRSGQVYDEWLVLRCQDGDASALPILIDRWQRRLVNYARLATKDADLAKDIIQDTWLNVIKALPSLRDPARFRVWLYQMATNKISDHFRHQEVVSKHIEYSKNNATHVEKDRDREQLEREEAVSYVLQQLSPDHRTVLALYYLGEFEVEEISHILSIPKGTVKSRLHHAREQFRENLEVENE
ncbi:MAG: sigma-70 family RNA polymerase sigma factor [Pseudomonadales bacterium]|nr:sigma-70 family RNA polymerase sigma factor [Pseudomonadales bacterium]MDP7143817.1 sigma-70 family RNA polymerase sigma factor [Pseudomonadales bacterium]MDP7357822.1 sigma-70 family RNA polymerase sigma factor [Pseudomonadales bacterium]MDP7596791.1 sigma-70 family RNA polymerase sigma factor [Pseudomonadales bacterium]HJN51589.1 sigma-70 family RNA polymerase sigma factor [Pseudomonadales bacterium]